MMKYIPQSEQDRSEMLSHIGVQSIEDLFVDIPHQYRCGSELDYPPAHSEHELRNHFSQLAKLSTAPDLNFAGGGIYSHDVPAIVPHLLQRSEYATSYTPYQPEVSQGTLQCIFEFQTLACQLLEMELSNASLYDGATSLGEALLMGLRIKKKSAGKILVSSTLHPYYKDVLTTYCEEFLDRFVWIDTENDRLCLKSLEEHWSNADLVVTQSPNVFGVVEDYSQIAELKRKDSGPIWITSTMEPVVFGMLHGPGFFGADIATAEGQSFGNHPYLGGSTYGIFCSKQEYLRNLPGRLVGETVDKEGQRAFTLTFATREQFIRRGRATSNICTNNNLNMLAGLIHLSVLGKQGIRDLARHNFSKAEYFKKSLSGNSGFTISDSPTFNEFVVNLNVPARSVLEKGLEESIVLGIDLGRFEEEWKHKLLIHVSEKHSQKDITQACELLTRIIRSP